MKDAHRSSVSPDVGHLLVLGPDRPGIVARVSSVLADLGANILSLHQHSSGPSPAAEGQRPGSGPGAGSGSAAQDAAGQGRFFQRTAFELPGLEQREDELRERLDAAVSRPLGMTCTLTRPVRPKRVAIFASTADHCLIDLLARERRGEIATDTVMVVSNHETLARDAAAFGVPFVHVPVPRGASAEETAANKQAAEQRHLELLRDAPAGPVDLVVLARYMQVLSPGFLEAVGVPVINIHHSFLPAFVGAGPYQRAKARGVKLVGATAHYVTEELDEGPIIEQDVIRVSHEHSATDLARMGATVECQVLGRAVTWHCDDRVIRDGRTTVVFS